MISLILRWTRDADWHLIVVTSGRVLVIWTGLAVGWALAYVALVVE